MNNYLLAGSYAYDTILLHKNHFHAKILPESLSRLNVAFNIDGVEDEFGGTAGNIAYNATLLKQNPLLIGCLGDDGLKYKERMISLGLDSSTLTFVEGQKTPHAWLMTDVTNNQIIGFHAGAMLSKPTLPLFTPNLWHLAADNPATTSWLAKTAVQEKKQYFFDPGQSLAYFSDNDADKYFPLKTIVENAKGIFVNDYEGELMSEMTKLKLEDMISGDQFLVRTLGGDGVELFHKGAKYHFNVAKTSRIVDPTGCGDSFRAGFLYGYTNHKNLDYCVKLGATMGSFAIEYSGGQNHKPLFENVILRMESSY